MNNISRKYTNLLLEFTENGMLDQDEVFKALLDYLPESVVSDFAQDVYGCSVGEEKALEETLDE